MDVRKFKKLPLLGILRGVAPDTIEPLVETIVSSGLETIEIAMNSRDAARLIQKAVRASNRRLTIGAGTVLNMEALDAALDAGASFIVAPVLVKDVVEYCVKKRIPVFPGALTPREIYEASQAGATMVKVFPSGFFGPAYFKEIKGPFNDIELLACGGVTQENMNEYFSNGASAVAFGASVFRKGLVSQKDFTGIRENIEKFTVQFREGHLPRPSS